MTTSKYEALLPFIKQALELPSAAPLHQEAQKLQANISGQHQDNAVDPVTQDSANQGSQDEVDTFFKLVHPDVDDEDVKKEQSQKQATFCDILRQRLK